MLSKMHPSESMPTKNSFVGWWSRRICAGSFILVRNSPSAIVAKEKGFALLLIRTEYGNLSFSNGVFAPTAALA